MTAASLQGLKDEIGSGGRQGYFAYSLQWFSDMTPDDRERGFDLLIDRVKEHRDPLAMETLGLLGCQRAVDTLAPIAHDDPSMLGSVARRAILRLRPGHGSAKEIGIDLEVHRGTVQGALHAYALRDVPLEDALEPLLVGLADPFLPTRVNSWDGLVTQLNVGAELLATHQTPLRAVKSRILTELPSVYLVGAMFARDAFRGLAEGRSAEQLGLEYLPGPTEWVADVWQAMQDREADTLASESIAKMWGHDRAWAEALVVFQLGTRADVRAVRTVEALAWDHLVPLLTEAIEKYSHREAFCRAAEASRERLRRGSSGGDS